jgi:ABC-2 type transport system permease protein
MSRLFKLEWYKVKAYRPFWVIIGLFTLCFFALGFSVKRFLDFFLRENADELAQVVSMQGGLPLFDFVDIWQNLSYVTYLFKWILAFVVIMSITNEFGHKTIKQNIIDGLSKREFILSKLGFIAALSLFSGVLLFLLGLFLGLLYSPVKSPDFIFLNSFFVLGAAWQTFSFLCFAMLVAFLIRRTAFAIILFLLYTAIIEPIATSVMRYEYSEPIWYFPSVSIAHIIRVPFPKYILREVQDYIAWQDLLINLGWTAVFILISYWILWKKDV